MSTVLRIELWHGFLLLILLAFVVSLKILEPWALLLGGLFMGVNFFLLGCGARWVLTPLASKGRRRTGVLLLFMKFLLFLGLLAALFFRLRLDAVSFAVGFSTFLVAIVIEALRLSQRVSD